MKDNKLRMILNKYGEENDATFKLFDNPAFDNSIIGMSHDNRVIYDYSKMIEEFSKDNNCTDEESEEFIEYNTMRALPYAGENGPIIIKENIDFIKEWYSD